VKLKREIDVPRASTELIKLAQTFLLDAGELEALRLMKANPRSVFLTDDAAARLVAQRLGYEVHGTIGVIVRALRRRQRTKRQVLNLLRVLPRRSTLFILPSLLKSVIEEIKAVNEAGS
jgi:predicted nucleic acid-binding protein